MTKLKPSDIGSIPPVAAGDEMATAATLLKRWRKALGEANLSVAWQRWILESLAAGLPPTTEADA